MKIIGGTRHDPKNDSPAICERCGVPIANEIFVQDDEGEIHSYGETCACRMVGNVTAEKATREAMEYKRAERRERQEAIERHVALAPIANIITSMRQRASELNKTNPIAALRLNHEIAELEHKAMTTADITHP